MDTSVWWSGDLFSAMRSTLGADRSREHLEAHAVGDTVASLEAGKKADVVLIKNDHSPAMFPLLNPYGHVAFQAQRGDVHTVVVDGRIVKHEHRPVRIELARVRSTWRPPSSTCAPSSARRPGNRA